MVEQTIGLMMIINSVLFIGLITGLLWRQRTHGRLTAKEFALTLTCFFSLSFVATLAPLLKTHTRTTIIVDIVYLGIMWIVAYPFFRWVYGQFNRSEK